MRFGYLACPYSHDDPAVLHARHRQICTIAGTLIESGLTFYCAIAHTHPIAYHSNMDPLDHNIWLPFDRPMMGFCSELWVAQMDGWSTSVGINAEMSYFDAHHKPIHYLDPSDPVAALI